ncbi:ankyrin repeat-containing domain protein [Nemania sp. FL0916]|nr:ankyrin repeat-containing domain protein [Nemania sp. FL0916]
MPDPDDYTIGWLCALDTEYTAAQTILDEKYDNVHALPPHDNNTYALGRVGRHYVVIAVLPHWEPGLVSAANAASHMVRSFPNLRVGLMVGIGGGAPTSTRDIRLGDVVVSSAGYGHGGVFQYDYGRTIQNRGFFETGFLNKPPACIMTAVTALKSQYEMVGHQFQETIANILHRYPKLRNRYQRPPASTDLLYRSDVIHVDNNGEDCETSCGDDASKLIIRDPRPANEDDPSIHYGLIASSNQLMMDASIRDELSEDREVLCFEMEAAGLMNQFPFLIVRGICDYSDTHKNLLWQGFAALTAAAYTKDLLSKFAPERVELEKRWGDMLSNVQQNVNEIHAVVESLTTNIHSMKIKKWLSPPDPSTNHANALNTRGISSENWLLNYEAYKRWKSDANSLLWLNGIPGCGKTILSSKVIEDLARTVTGQPIIYFYFDFTDKGKQSFDMMLRSFIYQLYNQEKGTQNLLDSLHSNFGEGETQPCLRSLIEVFSDMIQRIEKLWLVVDALDECKRRNDHTHGILRWIHNLFQGTQVRIHLLMTSRLEYDIETSFGKWARDQNSKANRMLFITIHIQPELMLEDIRTYIRARVHGEGSLFKRWTRLPNIQDEIEKSLITKSNGMFRWVACQLDELESCAIASEVRSALAELPKTLDETYTRIINNIPKRRRPITTRLLQFLTFSDRPLSLEEAADCIAVDVTSQRFDAENRIPDLKEISVYCSSLVIIDTKAIDTATPSSYDRHIIMLRAHHHRFDPYYVDKRPLGPFIRLAHYSVKEYLVSDQVHHLMARELEEKTARELITTVCLIYLLELPRVQQVDNIEKKYPLAWYAAQYWPVHAIGINNELLTKLMINFLACTNSLQMCYQLNIIPGCSDVPPMLYCAAYYGLDHLFSALFDSHSVDIDITYEDFGSPLCAASSQGHKNTVRKLLSYGADPNISGEFMTPLQFASSKGFDGIIELLLDYKADVNSLCSSYGTALHLAVRCGYATTVELLLSRGADPNLQHPTGGPALYHATNENNSKTIESLLKYGADPNIPHPIVGPILYHAIYEKNTKAIELLLKYGTDPIIPHPTGGPALYHAIYGNNTKAIELLLKYGTDPNIPHPTSGPILYHAIYKNNTKAVELLLDHGANPNILHPTGGPALFRAICEKNPKVAELLLDYGADPYFRHPAYRSALFQAIYENNTKVVELLLDHGANPYFQYPAYRSALHKAVNTGDREAAEMLLKHGANSYTVHHPTYRSALDNIAKRGNKKGLMLLRRCKSLDLGEAYNGRATEPLDQCNQEDEELESLENSSEASISLSWPQ